MLVECYSEVTISRSEGHLKVIPYIFSCNTVKDKTITTKLSPQLENMF